MGRPGNTHGTNRVLGEPSDSRPTYLIHVDTTGLPQISVPIPGTPKGREQYRKIFDTHITDTLRTFLEGLGGEVVNSLPTAALIVASIPDNKLEAVCAHRLVIRAEPNGTKHALKPEPKADEPWEG